MACTTGRCQQTKWREEAFVRIGLRIDRVFREACRGEHKTDVGSGGASVATLDTGSWLKIKRHKLR